MAVVRYREITKTCGLATDNNILALGPYIGWSKGLFHVGLFCWLFVWASSPRNSLIRCLKRAAKFSGKITEEEIKRIVNNRPRDKRREQ